VRFELDFAALSEAHGVPFAGMFAPNPRWRRWSGRTVELSNDRLRVTPRGRLLVRTVAMIFDRYLRESQQKQRYSRVI
jgi:oxygen-independent coproporphyrinogen-3 oxidase